MPYLLDEQRKCIEEARKKYGDYILPEQLKKMTDRRNIILITLDEVRPDHLSCYGYDKIKTEYIDSLAKEGVLFETCITASVFTPVSHASILTGLYPNQHGVRDPYASLNAESVAETLKKSGYKTAGYVGTGVISSLNDFNRGFDLYDEPVEGEDIYERELFTGEEPTEDIKRCRICGNWWIPRMLNWLRENHNSNFFVFGHFYDTHESSQEHFINKGLLKEGELSEWGYYDAKILLADRELIKPLTALLKELNIYHETTIVLMSDHGTNLGEHSAKEIPWRYSVVYPQHTNMWDTDVKTVFIMKGEGLTPGERVEGIARTVDVVPTLLNLCGIDSGIKYDGINLLPSIESGQIQTEYAYAEDLFEIRGPGAVQAIRTNEYKYMRNLTEMTDTLYNLIEDPKEQNPITDTNEHHKQLITRWRRKLNHILWHGEKPKTPKLTDKDKNIIEERLRALGYID